MSQIEAQGIYNFEIVRDGEVIDSWEVKNNVPTEGLNYILNTAANAGTPASAWYLGIYQGNYTPVATDTAALFPTNATECTSYSETARQVCSFAGSTAASVTNSASPAQFTFNATNTVYGSFVASASAKSSTGGVLLSAALFPASKTLATGDILKVTYTLNLASV
jgi:hypothetical protein